MEMSKSRHGLDFFKVMIPPLRCLVAGSLLYLCASGVWAWNALGHKIVVQIAYDTMTPHTRALCLRYNRSMQGRFPAQSLVEAGAWLDTLRSYKYLKPLHYIDMPFSDDATPLLPASRINAITGLQKALARLANPDTSLYDKGFNLRIVLHVLADLHQPLHAASRFSHRYPRGDAGGNRFALGKNRVAKNLHAYWDKGGGLLLLKKPYSSIHVKLAAKALELRWPCDQQTSIPDFTAWADESFQLAKTSAYGLRERSRPSWIYQLRVKAITAQRLAQAGCRLAAVLNGALDG